MRDEASGRPGRQWSTDTVVVGSVPLPDAHSTAPVALDTNLLFEAMELTTQFSSGADGPGLRGTPDPRELFPPEEVSDGLDQAAVGPGDAAAGPREASEQQGDVVYTDGDEQQGKLIYTKKIRKSLLETLVQKVKETLESTQKERRSTRLASKPKSALNMEQQATTLLMKKCGLLQEKEALNQAKEEEFRAKFVQPMEDNMVTNYRDTFGLQVVEGTDCLGAMAIHAEA